MSSSGPPNGAKVAVKPFSISLGAGSMRAPALRKPAPRRGKALGDDSDGEDGPSGAHEAVTAFDAAAGGAISSAKEAEPEQILVIAPLPNKDWRAEARRMKGTNLLPPEVQAARSGAATKFKPTEATPKYGLITNEPRKDGIDLSGDTVMADAATDATPARKTDDEIALQALLGNAGQDSTLVITSNLENEDWRTARRTEADAFKTDVQNRPDQASLEAYDAVPIDGFGAAMLRGMGWKDGEGIGKGKRKLAPTETKTYGRRQALLGIGAKSTAGAPEDLGVWGVKKGRIAKNEAFNPVMLKDKATGELITEAELQARREAAREEELRMAKNAQNGRKRDRDHRDDRKDLLRLKDRDRGSDRSRDSDRERDRPRENGDLEKHRSSRADSRDREKSYRDRDSGRDKERKPDSGRYREGDRDRDRDRDKDSSRRDRDEKYDDRSKGSSGDRDRSKHQTDSRNRADRKRDR